MCYVRNAKRPYLLTEEIVLDVTKMHTVNASARIFVFSWLIDWRLYMYGEKERPKQTVFIFYGLSYIQSKRMSI